MGNINTYEKDNIEDEPTNCTYCQEKLKTYSEFYPHESGGYCIFAPRSDTDYACPECAVKRCEDCGNELPRYLFLDCKLCEKTHCFNNTDMIYDNNPMLNCHKLCDARNCGYNIHEDNDDMFSSDDDKEDMAAISEYNSEEEQIKINDESRIFYITTKNGELLGSYSGSPKRAASKACVKLMKNIENDDDELKCVPHVIYAREICSVSKPEMFAYTCDVKKLDTPKIVVQENTNITYKYGVIISDLPLTIV